MIFHDVTDIVIPEGIVVKIHETDSGRVLWKKISANKLPAGHWEIIPYDDDNSHHIANLSAAHFCDSGNSLLYVGNDNLSVGERGYLTFETENNSFSLFRSLLYSYADETDYWDIKDCSIDPTSNIWVAVGGYRFYCSAFHDYRVRDSLPVKALAVCWSEALQRFCIAGADGSCLMDIYGNIYQDTSTSEVSPVPITSGFALCSANADYKFIAYRLFSAHSNNRGDAVSVSKDGYHWTYLQKISDDLPDSSSKYDRGIGVVWVNHLNAYVAVVGNSSGYFSYSSSDGRNWSRLSTFYSGSSAPASLARIIDCAYSTELHIIAAFAGNSAFISRDALHWLEVPAKGIFYGYNEFLGLKFFIWSHSLNAFIYSVFPDEFRFLVIDSLGA